jgi:enoyl-CoA hydratase
MAVSMTSDAGVRTLRLDSGRMNVLGPDALRALRRHVRDASADPDTHVIALLGRRDALSAGLDLATLAAGGVPAQELLVEMGELLLDLYGGAIRVVVGCAGHAVAAGAMLLLAADRRIGAVGSYKVGFSEVARGLPLPELPVALARERLDPRRLQAATLLAEVYGPREAVEIGFLDRLVPGAALEEGVAREAKALAGLPTEAYAETLRTLRGSTLERLHSALRLERERLTALQASVI